MSPNASLSTPTQIPEVLAATEPSPALYLNRELAWLEFNCRVLHEAQDKRTPLLERLKFLGIFTSNLDEFFMKRVGGLKRQAAAGIVQLSPDGMSPQEQLAAIRRKVRPRLERQAECFTQALRPELGARGVHLLSWDALSGAELAFAEHFFRTNVFPILTPLAVDSGHPFPFISNLSTSMGLALCHPQSEERLFARVKIPEALPCWLRVNPGDTAGGLRFISLLDLIRHNLGALFPNLSVLSVMPFRITRNADVERDEEDAEDLLEMIEEELRRRRFAKVVRLEHGPDPDPWILQFLMDELELAESDVYEMPAELEYAGLRPVWELNLPELRYPPWTPVPPPALADGETDLFGVIRQGDVLVHHPYESFEASVERFVLAAAGDPRVLAIKMTVYRTSEDSPFIHTLIRAAQAGKQVVCLVELKARFDEERNIYWAHKLEKAGVHVVYGIVGLKTHSKTVLVVRQDQDGLRCYAHLGSGNYHVQTARLYTDLGLFTCKPEFTEDVVELFHGLTGRSLKRDYRKLLVAPVNLKERMLEMIAREAEHRRRGRPSGIIAKMNGLEERTMTQALYAASKAGVSIDLIVRGICCLRPGVPGLSEHIRVLSVLGRFLEHSRLFYFRNGAEDPLDGCFFFGSADWMYRNMNTRVEAVAPIEERRLRERCWEILQAMLQDHRQAWEMQPDGAYVQRTPPPGATGVAALGSHLYLMELARGQARRVE